MGTVHHLQPRRNRSLVLPNGRDPTSVTANEVADMIGEISAVANRLRSRQSQDPDDIKAAAWLMFVAAVFTTAR